MSRMEEDSQKKATLLMFAAALPLTELMAISIINVIAVMHSSSETVTHTHTHTGHISMKGQQKYPIKSGMQSMDSSRKKARVTFAL